MAHTARGLWLVLAGLGLIMAFLLATPAPPAANAQSSGLELEKTLLKEGNLVQVGEELTFAITITNNWNTTVITLPMIDMYDQTVLGFVDATPAQDTHIAATGVLSWNNVLETTGPLAPGEQVVIYVRFIAEHPSPRVVNRAYTHDAYDSMGNAVGDGADEDDGIAEGGRTPLTKTLGLGVTPIAGQLITFNLTVRNDGAADVISLPVRDEFDPAALQFVSADPPIDGEGPGVVVWSNALRPPLPSVLAPGETITITVVFTALGNIDQTVNRAAVIGARDRFGNDLAPAADDVPIRIIGGATATPTPTPVIVQPTPTRPVVVIPDQPELPTPTSEATTTPTSVATATPTSEVTATATPEATSEAATATPIPGGGTPISLPDTAAPASRGGGWLLAWALLLVALGSGLAWRARHS